VNTWKVLWKFKYIFLVADKEDVQEKELEVGSISSGQVINIDREKEHIVMMVQDTEALLPFTQLVDHEAHLGNFLHPRLNRLASPENQTARQNFISSIFFFFPDSRRLIMLLM
jgi:hypothetical protein